jgi:hypothetical protein
VSNYTAGGEKRTKLRLGPEERVKVKRGDWVSKEKVSGYKRKLGVKREVAYVERLELKEISYRFRV